jgi:hypothetical protein
MPGSDTISSFAFFLSVVSILIAAASAWFLSVQTAADHERSRRKFAVDLVLHWVGSFEKETTAVNRFVERLSPEQCSLLQRAESLRIPAREKTRVVAFLKSQFPNIEKELAVDEKDDVVVLKEEHVYQIRNTALKYLNTLECVMTAWVYSIADKEIIVNQFQYLVDEREDRNAMQTFRQKIGTEHFPSISKFSTHIQKVRELQREQVGKQRIV